MRYSFVTPAFNRNIRRLISGTLFEKYYHSDSKLMNSIIWNKIISDVSEKVTANINDITNGVRHNIKNELL
jgi:hypothetical protein